MSKGSRSADIAREKVARAHALETQRLRRRRQIAGVSAVAVIAAAAGIAAAVVSSGAGTTGNAGRAGNGGKPNTRLAALSTLGKLAPAPSAGQLGPEGVPVPAATPLAGITSAATGRKVDGISCETTERTLFHTHVHLTVIVSGSPRLVPADIGVADSCLYWLHTHAADGVIHVESPVRRTFTLGQVFDIWGQPLGPGQVGPATGHVTALYDGKVYQGNPRNIPLNARAQIQLEVGTPLVAPQLITFPGGL